MEDRVKQAKELHNWLAKRPFDLAQSIAMRAAMRSLPYLHFAPTSWLRTYAFFALRPLLISWSAQNYPQLEWSRVAAESIDGYDLDEAALEDDESESPVDYVVLAAVNAAQSLKILFHPPTEVTAVDAVGMADGAVEMAKRSDFKLQLTPKDVWSQVKIDQKWLTANGKKRSIVRIFSRYGLWLGPQPQELEGLWFTLSTRLRTIDPNYSVWIDWYERRIRGERAAFDIAGDKYRKEDKKILRRLAEATDEDFWGKGHEYVNATLKGWLDEARARVAPPQPDGETEIRVPLQEPHAIAYGVNNDGMIDRLPHLDQTQLRDLPDQRRAYDDLRDAAAELLGEGQRLGHRLQRALDRFLHSLPDGFEDAEAYLVWRDANALRRLHSAHREAAKSREPDEARLEPVIAEGLGGLLDLYNNFAFADDGLRSKDEARIAPQERASAEAEAKAAVPLVEALLANPQIATPEALDDILADAENAELPADDPYAGQVLDQANRTKRNLFAGLISDTWAAFKNTGVVGQAIAGGAAWDGVKIAATTVAGVNYAPLLDFIATNPSLLQHYVAIAFPSFEHLPRVIEYLKLLWLKLRN